MKKQSLNLKDIAEIVSEKTRFPKTKVFEILKEGFETVAEETFVNGMPVKIHGIMQFTPHLIKPYRTKPGLAEKELTIPLRSVVTLRRGEKFRRKK